MPPTIRRVAPAALGLTAALASSAVLTACGAATSTTTPGASTTSRPPTIDVYGDSVTVQAFWGRDAQFAEGAPAGAIVRTHARPGSVIADHQAAVESRAADDIPSTLVIALGTNNAARLTDGWTSQDQTDATRLVHAAAPATCVVVVLPGGTQGPTQTLVDQTDFDQARAALEVAAKDRQVSGAPTVVADWGAVAAANEDLLAPDGIHLAADAARPGHLADGEAADAFAAVVWSGVEQCSGTAVTPTG
jgi:hypothetical protein